MTGPFQYLVGICVWVCHFLFLHATGTNHRQMVSVLGSQWMYVLKYRKQRDSEISCFLVTIQKYGNKTQIIHFAFFVLRIYVGNGKRTQETGN